MFPQINAPSSIHQRPGLSDDALRRFAPSVFAASPLPGVSERYAFVPTAQIVSRLRGAGWIPVTAFEQRVRLDERRGFQKHLLRFQRADMVPARGEYTPELVLVNSHDRSSAYQLHAGLFRFVCGNGMIVADTTFERVTYLKKDNAHCEQKNWTQVRQLFGHDRFGHAELVPLMNDLYAKEWRVGCQMPLATHSPSHVTLRAVKFLIRTSLLRVARVRSADRVVSALGLTPP
jgi:hypothetical protein